MLVKFKPVGWKLPILIDSTKIHVESDLVVLPKCDARDHDYCIIDDTTLAYLENAKVHEGMRRVKRKGSKSGWININAPLVYPDEMTGYMIEYDDGSMEVEGFAYLTFIPYEMEV
jgi:hypothetical protein